MLQGSQAPGLPMAYRRPRPASPMRPLPLCQQARGCRHLRLCLCLRLRLRLQLRLHL